MPPFNKSVSLIAPGILKGMNTSLAPEALPEGILAYCKNGRIENGVFKTRWLDSSWSTLPASGRIAGVFECYQDGVYTWFAAVSASSVITVYKSIDNGINWSAITPSSGAYGDCRFTDHTGADIITFAIVRDSAYYGQTAYDLIVLQNNSDAPRIYGKATSWSTGLTPGSYGCSKVTQPSLTVPPFLNYFAPESPLPVAAAASTTTSTGGANHLVATNPGSGLAYTWVATIGTATASGEFAQWILPAAQSWSNLTQATFILKTTSASVLNNISLEVTDNTNYDKVFPNAADFILVTPTGAPTGEIWYQLTVPIPPAATAVNYAAVKGVRLKWVGSSAPTTAITVTIICVMGGGDSTLNTNYGGSFFGAAQFSADSRTVGPGSIISRTPSPLNFLGGSYDYSTMSLTEDERMRGHYYIQWVNQSSSQLAAGIDYTLIYRKNPGDTDYYWVGAERVSSWGGASWANRRSTPFWYSDNLASSSTDIAITISDPTKPIPDQQTVCIPTGSAMATANGRLFVGASSTVWYSRFQMPWMFRGSVQFIDATNADDSSAGSFDKQGETIQAIVPLGFVDVGQESIGATPNSAAIVHYLTNRAFYRISGWDALSLNKSAMVAPYGTNSPFSIARSRIGVYWLDQTGQVRLYDGSSRIQAISLNRVDNYTIGLGSPQTVTACVVRDKFRLAIKEQNIILVFNEHLEDWESVDIPDSGSVSWIISGFTSNSLNIADVISYRDNGSIVLMDSWGTAGANNSPGLSFQLKFRPVHSNFATEMVVNSMTMFSNGGQHSVTHASWTVTTLRTVLGGTTPASGTGTFGLTASSTRSWIKDSVVAGVRGPCIQPSISGTVVGGWSIYGLSADVEIGTQTPSR